MSAVVREPANLKPASVSQTSQESELIPLVLIFSSLLAARSGSFDRAAFFDNRKPFVISGQ
jgi:hypothetical protein